MKIDPNIQSTIDYYNHNSLSYSKKIENKIPINQINNFLKIISKGKRVLDVGCAAGRDSREIIKKGFEIKGIDLSEGLLKIAKELDADSEYIKMDMRELSFIDKSFDGVYAAASLIHLNNEADIIRTIKEFNRVLSEDGILYLSLKKQLGKIKSEFVEEERSDNNPRLFQYFTEEEIIDILENNNFKVLKIDSRKSSRGDVVSWMDVYCKKLT